MMPEWLPAGALAHLDFINGNYFAAGDVRALTDLLTGPHFNSALIDAEGMFVSTGPASVNIPLMTPLLLGFLAESNASVVIEAKTQAEGPLATVLFSLMDNADYNSAGNQAMFYRGSSAQARVEDWVEVTVGELPGQWPEGPFTIKAGATLWRDLGAGQYEIASAFNGGHGASYVYTTPPTEWVIGAIGISEDVNDPANATSGGAGHHIRSFTVYPAQALGDLVPLTA